MKKNRILIPVVTLVLILGVVIGMKIQNAVSDDRVSEQVRKYNEVLQTTNKFYVDDIDSQKLTEAAIKGMLEELDPHSVYITADQLKRVNEDFQGSFEGIGVEFDVINDTLTVVSPISGGPSEKLGILAGDKIVKIDGESAIKISREDVPKKLRGPAGTKVNVTIMRAGSSNPLEFEITRDKIPLYSVDASFMYDDEIGYVKVSRFAATTYDEFVQALDKLEKQGMKKLVLDLRGNPGGYLDQAFKMASLFIERDRKIVYTKSRIKAFEEEYKSNGGKYSDVPLILLVNGGSASASEIVSGAIQDWDRGLIVGETTFGKGLVQRQYDLSDGSAFRITTARYYTPAGRLIQKPYDGAEYRKLLVEDIEGDNIEHSHDSDLDTTRPVFKTFGGRTVYGGGGITPDYVVKLDTLTPYTVQLRRLNVLYQYVENFMRGQRKSIESQYSSYRKFRDDFDVTDSMLDNLKDMASDKGVTYNSSEFSKDEPYIKAYIKSQIARDIWGDEGSYAVFVMSDDQFLKAVTLFDDAIRLANLNK
ncbi:MAG: S41 family peptidase [Ignavibacteriae bacterium]|nr:S41 family peptidase [Ignavibacteriota bacterium]MCB9242986.1 S41 family peptidase [Ignavibacteriales bacterium]